MKVSVIIPVYNEVRDIANCLKSLLNQKPIPEIIVVDDGSTDNSIQIIKSMPVKLLIQSHLGPAIARNLGAKHASGEILIFVDADMTFAPDFIANLIKPIFSKKAIGTFSKQEYVSNPKNIWSICWNLNRGLPPDKMHTQNYPDTQAVFRAILKSEFDRVHGFESVGYNDDWTLSQKLNILAVNAAGAVFYHRNPDNLFEVWHHAAWVAQRKYKSKFIALLRFSLPSSLVIGLYKSIKFNQPFFFVFKIIYDLSSFWSLLCYSQ